MSTVIESLRTRRLNVWEQAKSLADKAAEENRAFEASEQGTWDALNEELDKLDQRIKAAIDTEQRAKDQDAAFDKLQGRRQDRPTGGRDGGSGGNAGPADTLPPEFRAFLAGAPGAPRAYEVRPTNGGNGGPVDFRVLSKLTAAAGGNTVPTSFYEKLMAHLIETSGLMKTGPTVLNTTSGESIQIPKTTAHSSGAIVTEGSPISPSDPAFGQITLGAFKYGTLIQVSNELLTDTGVDLEGYLAMQAGRALGNAFGAHLVTGTGTGQPRGVVTDATSAATTTTGQTPVGAATGDNLIDLFYSIIAPYRESSSAAFLVKDSTMANIRKIKDTTGQYIFQPSLTLGTPDTLMGKPIYTDPFVAAPAAGAKAYLFGDFSQYFVRLAGGVRFERSDDFAFSSDLVTFRCLLRADAALVDLTGAIKYLTSAAT